MFLGFMTFLVTETSTSFHKMEFKFFLVPVIK